LAIGAIEAHAFCGEPIDIRRLDHRTVTAEIIAQIVSRDQQHVQRPLCSARCTHEQDATKRDDAKG
jgi:hypothetical protein